MDRHDRPLYQLCVLQLKVDLWPGWRLASVGLQFTVSGHLSIYPEGSGLHKATELTAARGWSLLSATLVLENMAVCEVAVKDMVHIGLCVARRGE